eukprot:UN32065
MSDSKRFIKTRSEKANNRGTKRGSLETDAHPAKKYRMVNGQKMDAKLLTVADNLQKKYHQINKSGAKQLWEIAAESGHGCSSTEFRTLRHIMDTYDCTSIGQTFLEDKVVEFPSGKGKYQQIKGERYERDLLDKAEFLAKDGSINLADIQAIWKLAMDGPGITETEHKTLL